MISSTILRMTDVALIGAGIMSATVGTLLKELDPSLTVTIFENLDDCALESSGGWNNAGTGHAANCELNYTPELPDGSVDIAKALEVNVQFDLSRQLWSYLVERGKIDDPAKFIHACPHMSFVTGEANRNFLRERYRAMSAHHCYAGMQYTEDSREIAGWAPLLMEGRAADTPVAATRMATGSDVDYGALTHLLVEQLANQRGVSVHYGHRVVELMRGEKEGWRIEVQNRETGEISVTRAKFVFIGAGGASIELLQKSGIPEGRLYGGFPVSGVWLRCDADAVAQRHHAKVYGKAAHGSPPMSVPHLDTRIVGGKRSVLFGPYAGFSTRFLKQGSLLDLFRSVRPANIFPMLDVALHSLQLEEYLVGQIVQTPHQMFETLQGFYPEARQNEWTEAVAGQRVQIIKANGRGGGELRFGTELVASQDRSIVALMGASPGASTAAHIALDVLQTCFADRLTEDAWLPRLKHIIPTYGIDLKRDAGACRRTRADTAATLGLDNV
ncbi:malate dehydrogenase (quinone) [Paraburkholderia sp. D15]|uniref:malate dehydrogenase (quinone) n=1 Tax=Paraburkholderia sp. D15 TaxID=2880218 RepID=UPI0024790CF3|nr:malate dehydrogenase (quinone) [Paraburkholderia sp. D15]WGS54058.1 malate dehydrogenase (quinone) [Paraburkholderia sp. D15]